MNITRIALTIFLHAHIVLCSDTVSQQSQSVTPAPTLQRKNLSGQSWWKQNPLAKQLNRITNRGNSEPFSLNPQSILRRVETLHPRLNSVNDTLFHYMNLTTAEIEQIISKVPSNMTEKQLHRSSAQRPYYGKADTHVAYVMNYIADKDGIITKNSFRAAINEQMYRLRSFHPQLCIDQKTKLGDNEFAICLLGETHTAECIEDGNTLQHCRGIDQHNVSTNMLRERQRTVRRIYIISILATIMMIYLPFPGLFWLSSFTSIALQRTFYVSLLLIDTLFLSKLVYAGILSKLWPNRSGLFPMSFRGPLPPAYENTPGEFFTHHLKRSLVTRNPIAILGVELPTDARFAYNRNITNPIGKGYIVNFFGTTHEECRQECLRRDACNAYQYDCTFRKGTTCSLFYGPNVRSARDLTSVKAVAGFTGVRLPHSI